MKHFFNIVCWAWVVSGLAWAKAPPNIVFFFTDDQTSSTLGCYGHPFVQTPHIDRLASQGFLFENARVSQSICWVSRTSILTGLTGRGYGTPEEPDLARPDAVRTLYPDLLREAGYRTGFFGKWHAKMPQNFRASDHFDEFQSIGRTPYFKQQEDGTLHHETDIIVDAGIAFLRNQPAGKPFALNLWFNAGHAEDGDRRPGIGHFPWPSSVNGLYEDMTMPPPRLNDPAIFEALPEFFKESITRERYFWRWNTEHKYQINMKAYLRMISGVDHAMGRFLAALKEAGLADNTIIVYSADNGFHMGNRGLAGKWSHFEESLKVPLVIYDPRVPPTTAGKKIREPVVNLDLPATFLEWAGLEVPATYHGKSLLPLLQNDPPAAWRTETFHEHFAVRNRIPAFEGVCGTRFKYARYVDHGTEFLHDLSSDPDELINLAHRDEYAQTLNEMRALTDRYVNQYGGPLPPLKGNFLPSTKPFPKASANPLDHAGNDGFISLFNGKNLQGWSGDKAYWSVKDGAITGTTDGTLKSNRFITWTASTVKNFDLRLRVKISAGGNSGIQYRGLSRPEFGLDVVSGYQCDIVANTPRYHGMLYEERGRRILGHTGEKVVIAPNAQPWIVDTMPVQEYPPETWLDFRVLAQGNHHQHWINDLPTSDVVDLDEAGRALEGVLAFQVHVGPAMTVQFKDIRIMHLPDDLPLKTPAECPIPTGAPGVRPQGRLPADWEPPRYSPSL